MALENNYSIIDNDLYKDYEYLEEVLDHTLEHENVNNAIFSIIFVDNDEIQSINRDYRNIDKITDVISFALEDDSDRIDNIRVLGDIYICIPRMKEQAKNYGHSEKRELSFLAVHGLLHLLGYDHMTKEDEKVMFNLQEMILNDKDIKR